MSSLRATAQHGNLITYYAQSMYMYFFSFIFLCLVSLLPVLLVSVKDAIYLIQHFHPWHLGDLGGAVIAALD